jgi:hypothetical protein
MKVEEPPQTQRNGTTNFNTQVPSLTTEYKDYEDYILTIEDGLDTHAPFIIFTNVSPEVFEFLAADENRILKSARFRYNFVTKHLILKMPEWDHETLAGLFRGMIDAQLIRMGVSDEFTSISSPKIRLGDWVKEPDMAWSPEITANVSVVLEVGSSEPSQQLKIEARGWVEPPGTPVQTCITIDLTPQNNITIDIWRLDGRLCRVSSRRSPSTAIVMQHIEIVRQNQQAQVNGWKRDQHLNQIATDRIELDFSMFVGRHATNLEQDILISRDSLLAFAARFWDRQARRPA